MGFQDMRRVVIALLAILWLALPAPAPVAAQNFPAIGFKNESPVPLIIQGWSLINGVQRRGAPIAIAPGRVAFDLNVPQGPRFYTVYNANQPALILLRDFPIPPRPGDALFIVRPSRMNPAQAEIVLPGTP
jgi:hypothetical protein